MSEATPEDAIPGRHEVGGVPLLYPDKLRLRADHARNMRGSCRINTYSFPTTESVDVQLSDDWPGKTNAYTAGDLFKEPNQGKLEHKITIGSRRAFHAQIVFAKVWRRI